MHNYNNDYASKLIWILKRAGIHVITNPFANAGVRIYDLPALPERVKKREG